MAKSKLASRYRRNKAAAKRSGALHHNPPMFTDIGMFILPAFGAYASARVGARFLGTLAAKASPKLGKHAAVGTSLAAFVAAWFAAHRWKPLEKFHTPIVVGAGIAALQTLIQAYLPKVGQFMNLAPAASPGTPLSLPMPVAAEGFGALTDDGNMYAQPNRDFFTYPSYNDAFDPGRYAGQSNPPPDVPGSPAEAVQSGAAIDHLGDLMEELGNDGSGWGSGFASN